MINNIQLVLIIFIINFKFINYTSFLLLLLYINLPEPQVIKVVTVKYTISKNSKNNIYLIINK